jgi:hypothetical protein
VARTFGTPDEKQVAEKEAARDSENDENYDSRASIPVVFIDNFMKDASKNTTLWEDLADWAALLVKNGLAHVVFVSSNVSTGKVLAKGKKRNKWTNGEGGLRCFFFFLCIALPGKSFSTVNLLDAPPEVSLQFLSRHLGKKKNAIEASIFFLTITLIGEDKITDEMYTIVEALGGRLNELELFVQKLKLNIAPQSKSGWVYDGLL